MMFLEVRSYISLACSWSNFFSVFLFLFVAFLKVASGARSKTGKK